MPQQYFGPYSEQYSDYANGGNANLGRFPLGHTLILPDGREYKFTLNDGTVEVAGNLYQGVAALTGNTNQLVTTAAAIDATAITATITTTIAAADIYAEGIAHVNDVTGEGYAYRIRRALSAGSAHASAASTATLTVNLAPGENIQVALDTTSQVTFTRNRYHQVTIHLSPPTAQLSGVSPGVAAADRFYWSQVKGWAAVLCNLTLLAGNPVQPDIATNGAVESYKRRAQSGGTTILGVVPTVSSWTALLDQDGTATAFLVHNTVAAGVTILVDITGPAAINAPIIGTCIKANASTDYALIDLMIA